MKLFCLFLLYLSAVCLATAQDLGFPEAAVSDPTILSENMPGLARQVMAVYKDGDRVRYLDNLFRLRIVAGQYEDALSSIASLRELLSAEHPERAMWMNVQYEIYCHAKAREQAEKLPFDNAYARSFREAFFHMDDKTSALVIRALTLVDPADLKQELQSDLDKQKGKSSISLTDAVKLISDYQVSEAYRTFAELDPPVIAADDGHRYIIEKDSLVRIPGPASVCILMMRPRKAPVRLPTLLKFTIYVDPNDNPNDARQTASNGYAAVIGFTRGKACGPGKPVPYEHDGSDAAGLIDWISVQDWSDGRVGMYGGSYEGFTQWATAKQMPKALKAIMTGAPAAPGVDVPMEGNVFWNFVYPWPFYTTSAKGADDATYGDHPRWQRLDHDWYVSGRAYRDLDKIDGTPNPIFDQWISHPSYDDYWQRLIPYEKDFARINVPVLVTAGYYYGGPGAAGYYFGQHQKYDPQAEDYLLIGPYHHIGAQYGVVGLLGNVYDSLGGYDLDPVAKINITDDIRYQWFDYVFKHGPKPALLQDKVNYQVTGANVWKHAPSLDAMSNGSLKFHLSPTRSGSAYQLSEQEPLRDAFVDLKVDLADRTDVDRSSQGGGVLNSAIDTWNGLEFISEPLSKPTELSGLFSGQFDFVTNKRDFDFDIALFEQTPSGQYFFLSEYWARASYVLDRSHRQLLTPEQRQRLDFKSVRLMSHQLQAGSRIVVVLSVIKEPGRQINYGTGKDVSDETIADAKEPLEIKWYGESYVVLPVGK